MMLIVITIVMVRSFALCFCCALTHPAIVRYCAMRSNLALTPLCLNSQYVVIGSGDWVLTPKLSWMLLSMFPLYIGLCIMFDGDVIPLYSGVCSNVLKMSILQWCIFISMKNQKEAKKGRGGEGGATSHSFSSRLNQKKRSSLELVDRGDC